jgi:hypothetical protein
MSEPRRSYVKGGEGGRIGLSAQAERAANARAVEKMSLRFMVVFLAGSGSVGLLRGSTEDRVKRAQKNSAASFGAAPSVRFPGSQEIGKT